MSLIKNISKFGMPIIIAMAVILGMYVQKNIDQSSKSQYHQPDNKLSAVINYIEREYVDTVDVDEMVENIIPKVLEELDPHSIYIPAVDYSAMNEPLEGNFDGIGVQFNIQKDTVVVIKTIEGGPSEKVGIHDGDRIVTVNDSLIAGVGIINEDVMKILRGTKGTKVNVGIFRRGEADLINFEITRGKIPLYSVDVSYMIDNSCGYIKLSKFSKTTYKEFQEATAKLKSKGMNKLIFDLRSNTGGVLDAAVNIIDEFLDYGKLIVYTQGKSRPKSSYYATSRKSLEDVDLVVLIDESSASASEIVAGAIQDNDRGLIVGRRSFGKGLVQEPVMFADGSSMRLTIARYYTPSGRCIQKSYENGFDDYFHDINNRYLNGEFMEKDSIQHPDSLKYYTTNGRIVYGGGGIMPDVFMALDTTGQSEYLVKISRKGLEYQFCFEYTDKNRSKLESYSDAYKLAEYLDKQAILNQFIAFAEKKGVKKDIKGLEISGETINTQLKALIARNIFDTEGFYPIIKDIDKTLLEGLRLINENKKK
ncbi:MAG: S41 family peptidase [Salinivirgaceae bacterium]|nr:S41 family peptidase [Salinivirgaceae bacterium]